jgi:carotenoid 1,2-hydratase
MTERGAKHVTRTQQQFNVGPSSMTWHDAELFIDINERCMPLPFSLQGRVNFVPGNLCAEPVALDDAGKHHWQAVAPCGRVTVDFIKPQLSWSGNAYHDMNWGEEPLEQAFKRWTWLRANTLRGTEVLYDLERKDGSRFSFGQCFENGEINVRSVPASRPLRRGIWGMNRDVPSEAPPRLIATLEDTPFYTRNHVGLTLDGVHCEAIHESLSMDRFVIPTVQMMLPFRMPRFA